MCVPQPVVSSQSLSLLISRNHLFSPLSLSDSKITHTHTHKHKHKHTSYVITSTLFIPRLSVLRSLFLTLSCRRLLQADAGAFDADGNTILTHRNVSSTAVREPFTPATPFDTSMALTILIILTALFFMGFFSVYIRRLSGDSNPSTASSTNARPAPSKGSGLDPTAVNLLPLVAYNMAEKHPMMEDCPICLSEFQEEESVKQIPYCGHVFHPSCIDTWLVSHVTCPLCRSTKLFQEV